MVSKKDALKYEQLQEPMLNIYLGLEYEMLMNIADTLADQKELLAIDPEVWQMQKLHELGMLERRNLTLIRKTADLTTAQLNQIIIQAGLMGNQETEEFLESAVKEGATPLIPPPVSSSPQVLNIMLAAQNNAKSIMNLTNATMLEGSKQIYKNIINASFVSMATGNITHDQALRRAISEWTANGIPALVDRGGKRWGTEGYVRTVLTSTMGNVTNQMQDARIQEAGVELVEISSHSGARPKCAPLQGRIFAIVDNHPKYPNLYRQPGVNKPDGMFGVNCGHRKYPFVEGFSEQRYKPYNEEENAKVYKESQKQREIERNIRKAKTEQDMLTKIGDTEGAAKAAQKVKNQQARMRDFIQQTGRTRRRYREQIVTSDKARDYLNNSSRTIAAQNKYVDKTAKEIQKKINESKVKPKTKTNITPKRSVMRPDKADIPKVKENVMQEVKARTAAQNAVDALNVADIAVSRQATGEVTERAIRTIRREFEPDQAVIFWDDIESAFGDGLIIKKQANGKYVVKDSLGLELEDIDPKDIVDKKSVGMSAEEFGKYKKKAQQEYNDKKTKEIAAARKAQLNIDRAIAKGVDADDVEKIANRREEFKKIDHKNLPTWAKERIDEVTELKRNDLTTSESINFYSSNNYIAINNYKRGIWDEEMFKMMAVDSDGAKFSKIKDLEKAFDRYAAPLEEDMLLYRHMGEDFLDHSLPSDIADQVKKLKNHIHDNYDTLEEAAEELNAMKNLLVNASFQDKTFVSTSYKDDVFTKYKGVELQILAPKGYSNGMFIEGLSEFGDAEREFLINAGQNFKIVDIGFDLEIEENLIIYVVPTK